MTYEVIVYGQRRLIKEINYHSETDFEALYQNHIIEINEQDTGGFYAKVTAPDGCMIVEGYYNNHSTPRSCNTMKDTITMCMENILFKEKYPA